MNNDEYTADELAHPATRLRIEALKILVRAIVEDAGEQGISVGELKRRLGIQPEPRP